MPMPMRKKAPGAIDLAVVVPGGKPPRRPPPDAMGELMGDEMEGEMPEEGAPMSAEGESDNPAFDVAAEEFLDPGAPLEDRKAALKRAIEACMGGGY